MTRIYILFADEPVFHPAILRELAVARAGEIVGVGGVSHRLGSERRSIYYRKQLDFWGLRGFLVNSLAVASRLVADRLPLPGRRKRIYSLRAVCEEYGIKYESVKNVNDGAYLESLRRLEPDVIVSSQGQIFRQELLALPKIGCINRHSALLPKYGGLKPLFWAMLNGEEEVGVSVHAMEEEIDQGPVLARVRISTRGGKSMYQLYKEVFGASGVAILQAIAVLEGSATPPRADPDVTPSYFAEPEKQHIRRFRDLGNRMV